MIPEFALIGHPNEGKSSILSTLSEDDSVVVSHIPGETTQCTSFPVRVDGTEILRFTDTPGFQHPGRILHEFEQCSGSPQENLLTVFKALEKDRVFSHDYELLKPLTRGAGVIYVVDGSRAVRQVDKTEMEILRLSGRPRMAIINCKNNQDHLQEWKNEFRQSFNSYRVFNAHKASYTERIHLLQSLCHIDQDWQENLRYAVDVLEKDWNNRTTATTQIILQSLGKALELTISTPLVENEEKCNADLFEKYSKAINKIEQDAHQNIRSLYKHNVFNYSLPPHSLLHDNVFTSTNWQAFGLSKKQLLVVGSMGGAAIGAGVDIAAAGLSFGIFTVAGTLGGAFSSLFGGKKIAEQGSSFAGMQVAGQELKVGPAQDIHLLFVLLNRALLFYRHSINWAHGRRDYDSYEETNLPAVNENITQTLSSTEIKVCHRFFSNTTGKTSKKVQLNQEEFSAIIHTLLQSFYR